MNIPLIKGHFDAQEALELITQMIHVKIKYQEGKISQNSNEEDIKMRENRIKELQKDLFAARQLLESKGSMIDIVSTIEIN